MGKFNFVSLILFFLFSINCIGQTIEVEKPDENLCTFSNPVKSGADPWVFKKGGYYYYSESQRGSIYVSRSKKLIDIGKNRQKVWTTPDHGWNSHNLWAPELHYVNGHWYIYYTAGKSGPPFIHQRSGVLKAVTDDPLGEYEDIGMLYTGDNIETGINNIWAIDLTVFERDDQLYAIWSGWEENKEDHRTPQHLYIAEMENPWTIRSNRIQISSPEESWETGSELALNEGPQVLENGDDLFVIYSASESWLPAYNLGQLRFTKSDSNPMDPGSWIKSGPVFQGSGEVHGVGHASFTRSPDNTENWILYHTKISSDPGWERAIHIQPFTWNEDGSPNFGIPVQPSEEINRPSGECEEIME